MRSHRQGGKIGTILENDVCLSVTRDSEEFLWKTGSVKGHEGNVGETGTEQDREQPIGSQR